MIVETKGLTKKFKETVAVNGLDLSIGEGEVYGIIGPDGAGKTTTLRLLTGLLSPTAGSARVLGFDLPSGSEGLKEHIGYMPQKFSLYTDLTVEENMRFFADIYQISKEELSRRLEPLLKMTRLEPFRDRLAANLSGGMKQKLALMCTLIHRPKLLILDEPTTGVDPVSRREFWEILQSILLEGVSIIVSTPYMDEAEWCTEIGFMFNGKLLASGTPKQLKETVKGSVLEAIPREKGEDIAMAVKSLRGVVESQPFGERYHILMKDRESSISAMGALSPIAQVREIPVSVEDVFVSSIKNI